jgi:hypothetical protein
MAVHCAKCGEELLGAVNRCWKCGQIFVRRPEMDGLPPVRMERPPEASEPLDAIVLMTIRSTYPASVFARRGRLPPLAGFAARHRLQYVPKPPRAPQRRHS